MSNEELALRIQNGETGYYTQLWEQNTGVFHMKAFSLYNANRERCAACGVTVDDILQVCFFALCDAVQTYKPENEYTFLAYIKFPLMNHFHALVGMRGRREPLNRASSLNETIGEEDETTRLDMLEDAESEEPLEAILDDVFQSELHDALEKAISKLPENRADIIRKLYFDNMTQSEIAAGIGKTSQLLHNLRFDAFRKLQQDKALRAFRDEVLSNMAYRRTGLKAFRQEGMSSVERAVIRAEELTARMR